MKYLLILFLCGIYKCDADKQKRYILYDVNPGEGFNLRRDVFMRIGVMVKRLNDESLKYSYTLVLPAWGPLYHWQSRELGIQSRIPWKNFFDVPSISRYVNSIDLEDFLVERKNKLTIDMVYYLQNYAEGWTNGEFIEKMDVQDCLESPPYDKNDENNMYNGHFFHFHKDIQAKNLQCLSIQGTTKMMKDFIENEIADKYETIMLDRAENLLHEYFGDAQYWSMRRSMRFAPKLTQIANDFRLKHLNSEDNKDGTVLPAKWESHKPKRGTPKGGPYVCAHVRRKDFVYSRRDQIPNLQSAAEQLLKKCQIHQVSRVFLATDAPKKEIEKLKSFFPKEIEIVNFVPDQETFKNIKDGGAAIVEQIICSKAKYFVGSPESTFTFRIQEEREIMGFDAKMTFDMLCPSGKFDCSKGSVWKIVYPTTKQHTEL